MRYPWHLLRICSEQNQNTNKNQITTVKTTIDNSAPVYIVRDSVGRRYLCNIGELNRVVNENHLIPDYFKIFSLAEGRTVSKKDLTRIFQANNLKQEFEY